MEDMIGTYRCLEPVSWPEAPVMPRTDYCPGLLYTVRPGNVDFAERMRGWLAEGKFEKVNGTASRATITGVATVRRKEV